MGDVWSSLAVPRWVVCLTRLERAGELNGRQALIVHAEESISVGRYMRAYRDQGLVERGENGWCITAKGRLYLTEARAMWRALEEGDL